MEERTYAILKFSNAIGVCVPPEFSEDRRVQTKVLFCYKKEDALIYRITQEPEQSETYVNIYRPQYRDGRNTATITLPPEWGQPGQRV